MGWEDRVNNNSNTRVCVHPNPLLEKSKEDLISIIDLQDTIVKKTASFAEKKMKAFDTAITEYGQAAKKCEEQAAAYQKAKSAFEKTEAKYNESIKMYEDITNKYNYEYAMGVSIQNILCAIGRLIEHIFLSPYYLYCWAFQDKKAVHEVLPATAVKV